MNKLRLSIFGLVLGALPIIAAADGLAPDEQAFFDKHIPELVKISPTKVTDAPVVKVFSAPFYQVKISLDQGDGSTQDQSIVVTRIDEKLVSVARPSGETDLPDFPKLLNADFKLKGDDDAKTMQQALDAIYPIVGDDDKKVEAFTHDGDQWTFVRGNFIGKKLGFIFQTDPSGAITSARFSLSIP